MTQFHKELVVQDFNRADSSYQPHGYAYAQMKKHVMRSYSDKNLQIKSNYSVS